MGSDRAMERVSYSTKAEWVQNDDDTQSLHIYRTCSEDGHKAKNIIWQGRPLPENEALIKILAGEIPKRPPIVIGPYGTIERVLDRVVGHKGAWGKSDANEIWDAFVQAGFRGKP